MNLPNFLTLVRIFLVPVLVVVLLTPYVDEILGIEAYGLAILIFLIATLTDVLDGHIARRRKQVSSFGALMDPIADKLLVSSMLIILVEKNLAPAWAVVILIGREFVVTGLRSAAAAEGVVISARNLGKFKMWAQSVAIVALLVVGANSVPVSNFGWQLPTMFWKVPEVKIAFEHLTTLALTSNDWKVFGYLVGRSALWISVISSIWSMYEYFKLYYQAKNSDEKKNDQSRPSK